MEFKSKLNLISPLFLILILFFAACSGDSNNEETPATPATPPVTTNLKIEPSNTFSALKLSTEEYNYWNSHSINSVEATAKIKTLCKTEIYPALKDEFDFIIVVMNNADLPQGMPYGEFQHVKNDTQGIGLDLFDHSSKFGSSGKLQGIYFLYKNNIDSGPVLHEMFHRWGNWVVPQNFTSHWDKVQGILTSVANNYADIELYLAGAIPASEIKDPESLAIYNDPRFTNKTRIPNSSNSQKSFKSLVVVMSTSNLTDTEITDFKTRIANITRTPSQGTTNSGYQNIYNKSKGLLTLTIGELDKAKK
ncbi:hypothetical protein [Flavobacterium gilvum]|uniref:Lipoprotein n=1 Tax=Flavobacterium gilvum TaxID=1492737 RepID=A0AAC9I3D0_9FLAO|nr:hypothetical protein [Flavobacterium gilvum]AOW08850.1 hypothetical protein EM308_04655 [Flavobacterium gilvum]KFC60079.1 hypothetical protein FEM08_11530 [Flavobacterium gilvum]